MRNKVQLYIEGLQADLDNNSFLLLNYTMEDLSNPTIVKNSFSRQITLKGTPRNDEIFGHIYRNDRDTLYGSPYTGPQFDPTRKTSFVIYNEMMEILESGYLKLDEVVITRKKREYKVTLYGGLGSFLYGLSYDTDGNKLTLADLDFGETLDFTINRAAVSDAWARLGGDTSKSAKWDIINFAPAYMGLPSGDFSANKALVYPAYCALEQKDGDYGTKDGWSLVTLSDKVTGNEAKDYRSYLQKPVIKLSALILAITDYAYDHGGWTVNLQSADFFDDSVPYWADTWLTLPMLNDLNLDIDTGSGNLGIGFAKQTIPSGGNLSYQYDIALKIVLNVVFDQIALYSQYWMHCEDDWAAGMQNDSPGFYLNYLEFTVQLFDSLDNVIWEKVYRASTRQAPDGYPQMDYIFDYIDSGGELYKDGSIFSIDILATAMGAASVKVAQSVKSLTWGNLRGGGNPMFVWPMNTYDYSMGELLYAYNLDHDNASFKYSYISSTTVRTGATITKTSLLSGEHTPADYLLSFCKMFGMGIVCSKDTKTVDIFLRKDLYSGGTVNINDRIDRGKQIVKKPFAFDARWYSFGNAHKGDYAEYYANKYGLPYGRFRVNTGYGFDADEKDLTNGIIFQDLCEVLETSPFFCDLSTFGTPVPSIFLGGGKYALYKGGETKEYDLPVLEWTARNWFNPTHPMHDDWTKVQFHGKDNAHMDERDTLLFFAGMTSPASSYLSLTDDTREMLSLNGNNPCWLPHYCQYDPDAGIASMPRFNRYLRSGGNIAYALDFAEPQETQFPAETFGTNPGIYDQYWGKYIADRYDDDSAVITCYVDLRGWKVDENLLRQFYWFDGALWALNRIIDHSLTTPGPTKCEFVKVQDSNNYTSL